MGVFDNKVALVAGGGRGMGRSCAQIFAGQGAKVVVASRTPADGEETVQIIRDAGGEAVFVKADISKSTDVQAMVQAAVKTYGGLDCAVNNAVISLGNLPLADIEEDDWERVMSVNFTGVFLCMKYEVQAMLKQPGGGVIVNIGSGNERTALPGYSWYLSAKQGIYGMTRVAALDYGDKGIRINALAPGNMMTPLMRDAAEKNPEHLAMRKVGIPLGRIAEPEEVAQVVVWLCGPEASYVHGHVMSVDGGFSLG